MTVIRSDVVGSLLRPEPLKEARPRWEAGELSAAGLKRIEDRAVDDAIRLQEDAGLDVVTDGELRCYAFFGHLIEALDGFDKFGGWALDPRAPRGLPAAGERSRPADRRVHRLRHRGRCPRQVGADGREARTLDRKIHRPVETLAGSITPRRG